MEYPLCDQTVTVYRQDEAPQVLRGCWFQWTDRHLRDVSGTRTVREFLLVVPGKELRIFPGDRVLPGEGPRQVDWQTFLPELVEGLVQVAWVKPCYWEGTLCHTEAGN